MAALEVRAFLRACIKPVRVLWRPRSVLAGGACITRVCVCVLWRPRVMLARGACITRMRVPLNLFVVVIRAGKDAPELPELSWIRGSMASLC